MKNNKIVNIIISLIVFVILLVIIILSNMNKEKVSFLEYISKNITKPFVNYKTFKENEQMADLDGVKYQELKNKLKKKQKKIEKKKKKILTEGKELEQKKLELRQIEILNSKIAELTEMLNLKNRYASIEGVVGKVIEESKNNLEEVVTINIGKNQGIKEGMAVVYSGGLYGKVISVNENTSIVKRIIDTTSKVSVQIGTIKQSMILEGNEDKNPKVTRIDDGLKIVKGMEVVTSGESDVLPKGIYIGRVSEVVVPPNKIDTYAKVELPENLKEVKNIMVLKNKE